MVRNLVNLYLGRNIEKYSWYFIESIIFIYFLVFIMLGDGREEK